MLTGASCESTANLRVFDGIIRFGVRQRHTERQYIGDQVDTAFIFTWSDFVKALEVLTDAGRTACYHALRLDGRFAKSLRETHGLLAWKS